MHGNLNVPSTVRQQNENITNILRGFLNDHDMFATCYSSPCATNNELEEFMQNEIEVHGLPAKALNKILHLSASLIELAYHGCTFEEKKQIALYNWFLIYIDDVSPNNIKAYIAFQERFIRKLPQLDPVLDRLASLLHAMFDFYPDFFANYIISATFNYISGTCIEPSVKKLQLSSVSIRFPWFLRQHTGVAVAYTLMLFPKSKKVDYLTCFLALADMDFWTAASNDLLSYHKESIDGDTANYIANRAVAEGKAPLQVVSDIQRELVKSRNHILKTLATTEEKEAISIWRTWEYGFITWHLQQKRYRLQELGV